MTLYIGLIGGGNISKRTRTRAPATAQAKEMSVNLFGIKLR
jgi:hypothetical protein